MFAALLGRAGKARRKEEEQRAVEEDIEDEALEEGLRRQSFTRGAEGKEG